MIVQVLYGMMAVSADNNNNVEYKHVTEEYDYHVVLKDLNEDQARYLIQDEGTVFKSDIIFKVVRADQYKNNYNDENRYDVYLLLVGDNIDKSYERFTNVYQPDLAALGSSAFLKTTTPLLTFENNIRNNNFTFVLITIVLLFVSIFLLTSLYNIRINQYKFQYGVYLTFGADFKMLFSTAFWELLVIFVVTFIPSMLISTGIAFVMYSMTGYGFVFNGLAILKVFLFTLVVILASVWTPMKIMSVKDPMSLIVTEDNSNLVTSPMRSFNIFMEKFPVKYEFYSIWRFRKYNIQLLTTAIVFCALFIMGLYMADIYTTDLVYPRPQFSVDLSDSGFVYDDIMSEELYSLEGVKAVEINDNTAEAYETSSHVIVHKDSVLPFKNLVVYNGTDFDVGEESWRASRDFIYTAMSEEQIRILESYDYEGDLTSVLQPGYVIVGDAISNIPTYDFEIGDKIYISKKTGQIKPVDMNLTGRVLLKNQIEFFRFEYYEFTVGAIINNVPCDSTPIYLNLKDYKTITGKTPKANSFNIYVEDGISSERVKELYAEVREWGRDYGDVTITNSEITFLNEVAKDKHYNELYICISILILCISPLVWFFSQSLYYSKREKEFNILQSIGAIAKEIKQIYLQGGFCMAFMSLFVSIILSYAGSYALFFIYNVVMPYFTKEHVRYTFYMPWYAILISIVMSVGCGFLSTYLPFRSYYKHRYSLQNGGAGQEYGADE
ncbi:MAG: ABC transporter permease [Ruminococcaceae bacterium]|nr:ABC transporter permease [Oscillospiraceae bacterium]